MNFGKTSYRFRKATGLPVVAGLLLCLGLVTSPAYGQGLSGRWAAAGKTMDNGEVVKAILDLKQTGTSIILITHDEHTLHHMSDRSLHLENGRLKEAVCA